MAAWFSCPKMLVVSEATATGRDERQAIDELGDRLRRRFPDVPADLVAETIARAHTEFAEAKIRDFVPVLVEHAAVNELKRSSGHLSGAVPSRAEAF